MRLNSIGSVAAIALIVSANRVGAQTIPSAIAAAEADLHAGHPAEAAAKVRTALAQQELPELHRALGDCLEAQGDFQHAAQEYRTAANADPSELNLFALGTELLKYHGYPQAEQVFTYAADRFPNSARILVGRGIALYSVGQYERAVDSLCRAVDLDPSDSRAVTFLGKMIGLSPELSVSVEKRLKRFATLYPQNASAQYFYGLSLLPSEVASAEQRFKRASALDPTLSDAHFQLGILYQKRHRNKEAIAEFLSVLRQQPSMKAAHYRLAQVYTETGQAHLAKRQYELVKLQPAKSAAEER